MSQKTLQNLIGKSLSIPTLPNVVMRIRKTLGDPGVGTSEIGALVSEDPSLAVKVLRIANSSFYGLSGECSTTEQASTVLGLRVLSNIVTQAGVIQCFDHVADDDLLRIQDLWVHASFTGHISSRLAMGARTSSLLDPNELYVCGLLHDVGKIVMLDGLGDQYLHTVKKALESGEPLHSVERAAFGFTHSDVGAFLAKRWDLPEVVARAIRYHHGPRRIVAVDPVVSIVAHANLLAKRLSEGAREGAEKILDEPTRTLLGLSTDDITEIVDWASEQNGQQL